MRWKLNTFEDICQGSVTPEWETPRGYELVELLYVLHLIYNGAPIPRAFSCIRSTWYQFRRKHTDWVERFERAEDLFMVRHLRTMGQIPDSKTSQWLLERRFPKDFGAKQQIEVVQRQEIADELVSLLRSKISDSAFAEVLDALDPPKKLNG